QGSVADQLVRESPRPVILVPSRGSHLGGKQLRFRRVLVPLDGSGASLGVIGHLLALPRVCELECVLVRAVDPDNAGASAMPPGGPVIGDADSRAQFRSTLIDRDLNDIAERMRGHGAAVEIR